MVQQARSAGEPPTLTRIRHAAATGGAAAPAHARFGVSIEEVAPGSCVSRMAQGDLLLDEAGELDLGALMVLTDTALGVPVGTSLPPGKRMTTLNIRVSTVSARLPQGGLRAEACIDDMDADTALSSGTITDDAGVTLARIWSRCAVLDLPPGNGAAKQLPPLDQEQAGSLPEALDARVTAGSGESLSLVARADAALANNGLAVQGGALAAVAEHTLSLALTKAVPALAAAEARDCEFVFLRGVRADGGPMNCTAHVQHTGRRFAAARAEVTDARGRLALVASASRYDGRSAAS